LNSGAPRKADAGEIDVTTRFRFHWFEGLGSAKYRRLPAHGRCLAL